MQPQSTLYEDEEIAALRTDRRNAVIVSGLGLIGVTISGVLLILGETAL